MQRRRRAASSRRSALRRLGSERSSCASALGGRAPLRIDEQRARDRREDVLREVGAERLERRRAALDPPRGLGEVAAPERVLARERLPEQDAERPRRRRPRSPSAPAGAPARCRRAFPGCRRAPSACRTPPSARARSRGAARRSTSDSASRTFDGLTSRWMIPRRGRARARRRSARATSIAARSSSSPARQRLAQRAAGDVLVGDVDVRRVARERDDPLAARVAERRRRAGLALGAVARLALARDDLQRDVEAGLLVACEPDLAHAAGAQRAQRAVPAEEEVVRSRRRGHGSLVRFREDISFAPTERTR